MSEKQFKDRIKGESQKKKDRDYCILELLAYQPELTQDEVLKLLNLDLTQGCISTIVRNNTQVYLDMVMKLNPLVLEEGRVLELIAMYRRKKNLGTKKDITDILEQLRREIKGDKPVIDQSQHLHLTNNINLEEFRKLPVQDKIRDILNRK